MFLHLLMTCNLKWAIQFVEVGLIALLLLFYAWVDRQTTQNQPLKRCMLLKLHTTIPCTFFRFNISFMLLLDDYLDVGSSYTQCQPLKRCILLKLHTTIPCTFSDLAFHLCYYQMIIWIQVLVTPSVILVNITALKNFLLGIYFDKSIVGLHTLLMICVCQMIIID